MSDHTTTITTDFAPSEVIVRGGDDGRWFRVLNWFYDEVVPDLTGAGLKVMLGLLRHRDPASGLARVSRSQLASQLKLSPGTVSDATTSLLAHPAGLLAEHPGAFETFPGRPFIGRQVRQAELDPPPKFDWPNTSSTGRTPSLENARAHQTAREKDRHLVRPEPEIAVSGLLAGWKGIGEGYRLRDHAAGIREALALLQVREPLLTRTAALVGLTIGEIEAIALEVRSDTGARNKPRILADRLFQRRGLCVPKELTSKRMTVESLRLEVIRQQRGFR